MFLHLWTLGLLTSFIRRNLSNGGDILSKESSAAKKAQELNQLVGYRRFTVIRTPLPGQGGATLNDSWSVHDTKTGENYAIGSIYGTTALAVLVAQLKKQKVDAVSGPSPGKRRQSARHSDEDFADQSLESLEHYGRKGMKWGQHIFGEDKMYSIASKKLQKLDTRLKKSEGRADKLYAKALRRQERANSALVFKKSRMRTAANSTKKLAQIELRMQQRAAKAKNWYDAMSDVFGDAKISELKNTDIGKKYAEMTINDLMVYGSAAATMTQLAAYYKNQSRR